MYLLSTLDPKGISEFTLWMNYVFQKFVSKSKNLKIHSFLTAAAVVLSCLQQQFHVLIFVRHFLIWMENSLGLNFQNSPIFDRNGSKKKGGNLKGICLADVFSDWFRFPHRFFYGGLILTIVVIIAIYEK